MCPQNDGQVTSHTTLHYIVLLYVSTEWWPSNQSHPSSLYSLTICVHRMIAKLPVTPLFIIQSYYMCPQNDGQVTSHTPLRYTVLLYVSTEWWPGYQSHHSSVLLYVSTEWWPSNQSHPSSLYSLTICVHRMMARLPVTPLFIIQSYYMCPQNDGQVTSHTPLRYTVLLYVSTEWWPGYQSHPSSLYSLPICVHRMIAKLPVTPLFIIQSYYMCPQNDSQVTSHTPLHYIVLLYVHRMMARLPVTPLFII